MLGGKDYVDHCMQDDFIRENILRNIRGAAQINGKIDITVSDKESKKALKESFAAFGLTKEEIGTVSFTHDLSLIKKFDNNIPDEKAFYDSILEARNSGDEFRFGAYADCIKLFSIHNAPKGQLVEMVDLDQQVDIAKSPKFKVKGNEILYTSMHLGQHSGDPSFRRHDMNKKELAEYCRENGRDINNLAYSNERSYLVGVGQDERIIDVAFAARQMPHFLLLAKAFADQQLRIPPSNIYDKTMPEEVRENMIKRFHLDFSQTSLLEQEKARGLDVPFERLSKSKEAKREMLENGDEESASSVEDFKGKLADQDFGRKSSGKIVAQSHETPFASEFGQVNFPKTLEQNEALGQILSTDKIGNQKDNTSPNHSVGQIALVGTLVAGVGMFIANKFGAGNGGGKKGGGGGKKSR